MKRPSSKLTTAEELVLNVFGCWIATQVKTTREAQGVADLITRFERPDQGAARSRTRARREI